MKSLIEAIEKREDVSPKEGERKYGSDANFADAKNKKYPLDTAAHTRAAASYFGMPKNRAKYSEADQKSIDAKIAAAKKKFGIGDNDDDKGDKTESSEGVLVYADATYTFDGTLPESIVYLPKGRSTITPRVNGKPKTIEVNVETKAAEILQRSLEQRQASDPVQPCGYFDHRNGPASFFPKQFRWDDELGVMLDVDWSQSGEEAISGKNYSYFSPCFLVKDDKVSGLPKRGEVGSLVNDPAFREIKKIQKIAASADDDAGENEIMIKVAEKLVELEVITAEQADDPDTVIKAVTDMHVTIGLVQSANARLQTENTALAAKVADVQKAEATSVIEAAIAEGKIGAKDKTSIDFYMAQLIASPETTKKVLASMPTNPLLQRVIDVKAGDTKRMAQGTSAAELVQAQHLAVREVQEKHPGLSYQDAFNKARMERPEVFPVEASR